MNALGVYDGTLQMFVQEPRDADLRHLRFLRWLAEHGKLAHDMVGPRGERFAPAPPADPDDTWPTAA